MYIMLTGSPPFNAATDKEIMEMIKEGKYNKEPKEFFDISKSTCSTVISLLEYDPESRPSASQVLEHSCFKELNIKMDEVKPLLFIIEFVHAYEECLSESA